MNQLIKKNRTEGYDKVYPNTYINSIFDPVSGKSLDLILDSLNCYFLSYNGSRASTRNLVPERIRKTGLLISYTKYDNTTVFEVYQSNNIDDASWINSSNWKDLIDLVGTKIEISHDGTWIINGVDTGKKAVGSLEYPTLFILPTMHLYVTPTPTTVEFDVKEDTGHLVIERDLTEIIESIN